MENFVVAVVVVAVAKGKGIRAKMSEHARTKDICDFIVNPVREKNKVNESVHSAQTFLRAKQFCCRRNESQFDEKIDFSCSCSVCVCVCVTCNIKYRSEPT